LLKKFTENHGEATAYPVKREHFSAFRWENLKQRRLKPAEKDPRRQGKAKISQPDTSQWNEW
jgi:hypothetical protein